MFHAEAGRTSIFMTSRIAVLFLLSLCAAQFARAQTAPQSEPATLARLVARLGSKGNDDVADIKQLAGNPRESAGLLIDGIHTIPDSEQYAKADNSSMEHVLELIRALRYITGGKDLCAQTQHVFGSSEEEKNRKYWLNFRHKTCLSFFGYWMSRDRTYIAPLDAQKNIIAQWKNWYAKYGVAFSYKPLHDPAPQDWLW
jgi:hypothetical protein